MHVTSPSCHGRRAGTAARPRPLLCSGIVGMAVPCAARGFKSDSSKETLINSAWRSSLTRPRAL
ncbi:hypothetical protein A8E41_40145 [Burkholderia cenocepacia]|nr:hypothetical protein A8E41_40145 [Burkholderia cenocepacia]